MPFDYRKLRGKIKEFYGTETEFALALGLSRTSLSMRLNNLVQFTSDEMAKSAELLHFPIQDLHIYFFTPEVQKHEQD